MPILKHRLGSNIAISGYNYREPFSINGVKFSFHSAGHIIGSAQIRVEYKGNVWVVSGDYKKEDDGLSTAFEVVKCHSFITESTFGLPAFNWIDQKIIFDEINEWWQENIRHKRPSIITAYSLGKAQRVLNGIAELGPVFCHKSIAKTNDVIRSYIPMLRPNKEILENTSPKEFDGAMILCPSSALNSNSIKKIKNASIASVSGWMAIRNHRKRIGLDKAFVLSDHADWIGLNQTIKETSAEQIFVTHGYTDVFSKWLVEKGYDAKVVKSSFGAEDD